MNGIAYAAVKGPARGCTLLVRCTHSPTSIPSPLLARVKALGLTGDHALVLRRSPRTSSCWTAGWVTPQASFSTSRPTQRPQVQSADSILTAQRLRRPVAPHLGIYKWQITSVLSILERITGIMFSGGLYVFGSLYAANHFTGLGMDMSAATMATAFGGLPVVAKGLVKFGIAWPFVFHCVNGMRYLTWDTARGINNLTVKRSGMLVVGISTVIALGLAAM